MKEKVALWGTGSLAKKFCMLNQEQYEIVCCYDNDESKWNTIFLDEIPIKKWDGNCLYKIIIASSFWREIAKQLSRDGLEPFKDYALCRHVADFGDVFYSEIYELTKEIAGRESVDWSSIFPGKKLAVVYGNCQTACIEKVLRQNRQFAENYVVIRTPKVYEWISGNRGILECCLNDDNFLTAIDLFIYQAVSENNKFSPSLCTDRLLKKLKPTCQKVRIVDLYFTGYFPQVIISKTIIGGLFLYGDKYIDAYMKQGMASEEILKLVLDEDFIPAKEIFCNAEKSLDELKRRECQADVKITDYITAYYQREQLFYSQHHPIEKLMAEYINRILEFLGYQRKAFDVGGENSLKGQDIPVYPAVVKALGLKSIQEKYYPNIWREKDILLDIREFFELYIQYRQKADHELCHQ